MGQNYQGHSGVGPAILDQVIHSIEEHAPDLQAHTLILPVTKVNRDWAAHCHTDYPFYSVFMLKLLRNYKDMYKL